MFLFFKFSHLNLEWSLTKS